MTAALTSPEQVAADRPLRMVRVSANLLPVEILDSRRERKVRRVVLAALAGCLVLMAAWYALARYQTADAQDTLSGVQEQVTSLQNQQHKYSGVVATQAQAEAIGKQLNDLFAGDIQWSALLSSIRAAVPAGIGLTSLACALNDPKATVAVGGVTTLPNMTASKPIGSVTISGTATSKTVVATYMDALAKVANIGNPYVNGVTLEDKTYQFTVKLDILATAVSGRYTKSTGGK
jgi:Tfp pilus assembly protein PilN